MTIHFAPYRHVEHRRRRACGATGGSWTETKARVSCARCCKTREYQETPGEPAPPAVRRVALAPDAITTFAAGDRVIVRPTVGSAAPYLARLIREHDERGWAVVAPEEGGANRTVLFSQLTHAGEAEAIEINERKTLRDLYTLLGQELAQDDAPAALITLGYLERCLQAIVNERVRS